MNTERQFPKLNINLLNENWRNAKNEQKPKLLKTIGNDFGSYICRSLQIDRRLHRFLLAQRAASGSPLQLYDSEQTRTERSSEKTKTRRDSYSRNLKPKRRNQKNHSREKEIDRILERSHHPRSVRSKLETRECERVCEREISKFEKYSLDLLGVWGFYTAGIGIENVLSDSVWFEAIKNLKSAFCYTNLFSSVILLDVWDHATS